MHRGKILDVDRVRAMQRKAVQFVANVLDDPDKADEIEDLSVDEYAERKGIRLNPSTHKEKNPMATKPTNRELQDTLDDVATKVAQMLYPTLTRKEVVVIAQELDEVINGS